MVYESKVMVDTRTKASGCFREPRSKLRESKCFADENAKYGPAPRLLFSLLASLASRIPSRYIAALFNVKLANKDLSYFFDRLRCNRSSNDQMLFANFNEF